MNVNSWELMFVELLLRLQVFPLLCVPRVISRKTYRVYAHMRVTCCTC